MVDKFFRVSVGKTVTYLTRVWACFVGFSRLTKKKKAKIATHSRFYIWLSSLSNADSCCSYANETMPGV